MIKIVEIEIVDILQILDEARKEQELIRVELHYRDKTEVKEYRFKIGFPNGLESHSVKGWYSTNFKDDGLYLSSKDFATYISNVNSCVGKDITYTVTRRKEQEAGDNGQT